MKEYRYEALREIGCDPLTSERCAAHMRTYCDVSREFAELVSQFIEMPLDWDRMTSPANASRETHRSMMLSRDLLRDLWIFKQLQDGNYVLQSGDSFYTLDAEELAHWENVEGGMQAAGFKNIRMFRPWQRKYGVTRSDGTNVHQFRAMLGEESK